VLDEQKGCILLKMPPLIPSSTIGQADGRGHIRTALYYINGILYSVIDHAEYNERYDVPCNRKRQLQEVKVWKIRLERSYTLRRHGSDKTIYSI